jgi:hypothetical protein
MDISEIIRVKTLIVPPWQFIVDCQMISTQFRYCVLIRNLTKSIEFSTTICCGVRNLRVLKSDCRFCYKTFNIRNSVRPEKSQPLPATIIYTFVLIVFSQFDCEISIQICSAISFLRSQFNKGVLKLNLIVISLI